MKHLKRILVLSSLLILASSAQASDRKGYNGNVCKSYYGSQTSRIISYSSGAYNSSTSDTWVTCPIVADSTSPTTGTKSTWIYYSGSAGNGKISCYLKSKNSSGSTRQTKSGSRTGSGWIGIPEITSESYWGSLALYCYLPKKGRIATIVIDEK